MVRRVDRGSRNPSLRSTTKKSVVLTLSGQLDTKLGRARDEGNRRSNGNTFAESGGKKRDGASDPLLRLSSKLSGTATFRAFFLLFLSLSGLDSEAQGFAFFDVATVRAVHGVV